MSKKPEQIKFSNFPSTQNIQNNLNYSPSPTKKKSSNYKKKKSKLPKKQLFTEEKENLLYFHNENIDSKQYYKEKRKKELLEQTNNLNNDIASPPIIINNNSDKSDISDILDNSINDCFLDFSNSENEEIKKEKEKEKEREEIIKKLEKRTDDVSLIKFDIYDYSKLIDINDDINSIYLETKNKKDIKFIDDDKISTNSSDKHSPKIILIKKASIKNKKNYEKRQNNFKRMKIIPKNEKSISKNKNKERSRTRSIKH